jgi:hypothetical protein
MFNDKPGTFPGPPHQSAQSRPNIHCACFSISSLFFDIANSHYIFQSRRTSALVLYRAWLWTRTCFEGGYQLRHARILMHTLLHMNTHFCANTAGSCTVSAFVLFPLSYCTWTPIDAGRDRSQHPFVIFLSLCEFSSQPLRCYIWRYCVRSPGGTFCFTLRTQELYFHSTPLPARAVSCFRYNLNDSLQLQKLSSHCQVQLRLASVLCSRLGPLRALVLAPQIFSLLANFSPNTQQ